MKAAPRKIVAADGKPTRTKDDLLDPIENKKPGDRVVVTNLQTPVNGMLLREANEEASASDE